MEKYARQAVSEGVKSPDDLHIGGDSEIYRVLNLHYNRNNHIEVSTCGTVNSIIIILISKIFIHDHRSCGYHCEAKHSPMHWKRAKYLIDIYTSGTSSIPRSSWANVTRIFPFHSKWQGHRTIMEKIHIQGYFPHGWFSSRIFQISELLGAAWIIEPITRQK